MTDEDVLDEYGLPPHPEAIHAIRRMLREESDKERREQGLGDTQLMKACAVQLFATGAVDEVLPIWEAKRSSMDADGAIDVQLLCGAGLSGTKEYLRHSSAPEAARVLAYLEACEGSGDFDGFSPESLLAFYLDYYAED